MSRPFFDRTSEFRSAVESAAFRAASAGSSSAQAQQPLLNGSAGGAAPKGRNAQRSEFARMAAKIGKDIQQTTGKLEKLAQRQSSSRCIASQLGQAGLPTACPVQKDLSSPLTRSS